MNVLCMNVYNEEKLIKSGFVPPNLYNSRWEDDNIKWVYFPPLLKIVGRRRTEGSKLGDP